MRSEEILGPRMTWNSAQVFNVYFPDKKYSDLYGTEYTHLFKKLVYQSIQVQSLIKKKSKD